MNFIQRLFKGLLPKGDDGLFRKIPLSVQGELFVSPMPFGAYDPNNRVFRIYLQNKVDHVFVLVTDDELVRKARRDLLGKYRAAGIQYSRFILGDLMSPSIATVHEIVDKALNLLTRYRVAVHCHAGVGRTAVAVCCIASAVEGWTAEEATKNICRFMTVHITEEQKSFIKKYEESLKSIT